MKKVKAVHKKTGSQAYFSEITWRTSSNTHEWDRISTEKVVEPEAEVVTQEEVDSFIPSSDLNIKDVRSHSKTIKDMTELLRFFEGDKRKQAKNIASKRIKELNA